MSFMNLPVTSILYSISYQLKVFFKIIAFKCFPAFCIGNSLGGFRIYMFFCFVTYFHVDYSTDQ